MFLSWGELPMTLPEEHRAPLLPTSITGDWYDAWLDSTVQHREHLSQDLLPRIGAVLPIPSMPNAELPAPESDPLDFVLTNVEDAVNRINKEYFFRRDTSEICTQSALTGELQV